MRRCVCSSPLLPPVATLCAPRLTHPVCCLSVRFLIKIGQMRQYLKVDEKWKDWENLEMQWIHHHNPDLVVLDDNGKEKERIDLQGLTADRLEAYLESKGFKRR